MSFTTGKGGIFDQVNRFYSSGNNILVEQTPISNNENESPKHISNSHDESMNDLDASMKKSTNEINNFFDENPSTTHQAQHTRNLAIKWIQ